MTSTDTETLELAHERNQKALYMIQQQLGKGEWSLHDIRRVLEGDDRRSLYC